MEDKTKDEIAELKQLLEQCRRAEQKRHKETKSLLISALESTADGILVVDRKGNVTYYNQKFVDMWQIPDSLLSTKDDAKILSYVLGQLSEPEAFIMKVNELYDKPSESSFDTIEFKDGKIFERYSQSQIMDDDILGRVWSFRDITKAIAAQRKLLKSEKRYRQLVELHHAGICVFDKDDYSIYVNPAMAEMLGYTAGELIGHKPQEFVDESDALLIQEIKETLRAGKMEQRDLKFIKKDGAKLYTMVDLSPIFNDSGVYEGAIAGVIDVSEKRLIEQELRHAQKMESIGQLAGGIAHDFNNIISSVINYVYLIKRKINDITSEELHDFVDEIQASAERASNLTKNLLVFSRKHAFEFNTVNLVHIINGMKVLLINLIGDDIELELSMPDSELHIYADVNQIEMMLMNLAANARDAMVDGGKLGITVQKVKSNERFMKFASVEHTQDYVLLSISDTGMGMANETMIKIFDPFFTTKEVGKGTGLGLSTVYGVVKQHKGYIEVKSELNKGTTFLIYLPLTDNFITNENAVTICDVQHGKGRILIAEDDESLRKVTTRVLTRAGYDVITAGDGEEVVKLYAENTVDLIIMDIIMPKMNGKAAYDKIIAINKDAKVIFVSGYTDVYLENKQIKDENFNYITKPIDVVKLLSVIREVLSK
ncbi:PAS domain-containing hybrid sensor histidine kinase/response regulator [Candidatus Magnetominusculus xianensis]|uniref:histidine kinase n=1 Tax=Candidatus Magnetominusculus xianensis TaxID=1748249 RepID=A0ABR5SI47_9BACT|nr:PAS domain-containing sensor histidine kinase [Candidatus Magnetominusculus xianensis]KWT91959.1 PAS domain-containing two-component system sensor histidine kinase/response regulator [Candidatus Magnetominusculus xianensis]MBF0403232.1 PAS domain S-box protein [Nitrospirota bacterium]